MILMSKYKGKHGGKKGQKIRAWVDPPLIRAMPERKRFFSIDVFPYLTCSRFEKPPFSLICAFSLFCAGKASGVRIN